jgi:hypothetical protein
VTATRTLRKRKEGESSPTAPADEARISVIEQVVARWTRRRQQKIQRYSGRPDQEQMLRFAQDDNEGLRMTIA